jgi:hypothetical protein
MRSTDDGDRAYDEAKDAGRLPEQRRRRAHLRDRLKAEGFAFVDNGLGESIEIIIGDDVVEVWPDSRLWAMKGQPGRGPRAAGVGVDELVRFVTERTAKAS